MSKNSFASLLDIIREDLTVDEHMAEISSGDPVFEYLQLAICIRYLAGAILLVFVLLVLTHTHPGGSYLDIADVYKVHETTVMPIVWRVRFVPVFCQCPAVNGPSGY